MARTQQITKHRVRLVPVQPSCNGAYDHVGFSFVEVFAEIRDDGRVVVEDDGVAVAFEIDHIHSQVADSLPVEDTGAADQPEFAAQFQLLFTECEYLTHDPEPGWCKKHDDWEEHEEQDNPARADGGRHVQIGPAQSRRK